LESLKTILYLQPRNAAGRYSSGQRGRTVNPLITSSQVRILLSPQTKTPKHVKSSLLYMFWSFCLGKVSPIRLSEGNPVYLITNCFIKTKKDGLKSIPIQIASQLRILKETLPQIIISKIVLETF